MYVPLVPEHVACCVIASVYNLSFVANVSIEFSEYTVMEGDGEANVCVVANGFGFTVSLQTNFTDTTGKHTQSSN